MLAPFSRTIIRGTRNPAMTQDAGGAAAALWGMAGKNRPAFA